MEFVVQKIEDLPNVAKALLDGLEGRKVALKNFDYKVQSKRLYDFIDKNIKR